MCADMVGPCMSVSNISSSTPHRSVARCPTEVASRLSPALLRSVGVSSRAVYANAGRPRVRTAASAAANGLSDRSEPGEFKDISGEHPPIETIPEPPPAQVLLPCSMRFRCRNKMQCFSKLRISIMPDRCSNRQAPRCDFGMQGIGERIKRFFLGDKLDKSRLAALGLGAVASYGFISNVTYGGGMAVAWIAFVKQMGRSPLMPGQWKVGIGLLYRCKLSWLAPLLRSYRWIRLQSIFRKRR